MSQDVLARTRSRARSWPLRRLLVAAVALWGAAVVGWAAVSMRRRPRGHEVISRMAHREAAPDPAPEGVTRTPIVLLHGLGMSGRSMGRLVEALGETTRALAPDLPGYGRSPQPAIGALDVKDLARAVLAWMDDREIVDVVLVGHSVGSQVAGEVALLAPGRVRRLVVIGPTGDPSRPSVLRQALRLLRGVGHEPFQLVGIAVVDYLRAGPGQMVVLMRRAVQRSLRQQHVRVDVPLLVVRGSRDLVCSQAWCEEVVARNAGSRLLVVEDVAHGLVLDAPPELVAALREEVLAATADSPARP